MKNINIPFENSEYERLTKAKGEKTWREFIMNCAGGEEKMKERTEMSEAKGKGTFMAAPPEDAHTNIYSDDVHINARPERKTPDRDFTENRIKPPPQLIKLFRQTAAVSECTARTALNFYLVMRRRGFEHCEIWIFFLDLFPVLVFAELSDSLAVEGRLEQWHAECM